MDLGKSCHPCGVCSVCPTSLFDIFMWWFDPPFRNLEKRLWVTLFYMVIWLAQNATVFNHSEQHVHDETQIEASFKAILTDIEVIRWLRVAVLLAREVFLS
ncbi:hypothetical protein LOK49_LG09G01644 [Camellia lanceoleosa]|uniref:Uncharacterized protein n=1 Tax=Camellia lanceoleosa TaxID=1840588 RepID=A0ACC0GP49_9ERIC|nr:hypothetical protein LOK49_LG09G01644 [Camellia lanceoleosa]